MAQSAYIKFVEGSTIPSLSLDQLKDQLMHYKEQLKLTGQQLDWEYANAGFPYTVETKADSAEPWFYLKGTDPLYHYIVMGTGSTQEGGASKSYVQVVLPDGATHGDKAKGNEFCKYLAKLWKAELHLFNGRVMYFNPRK